MFNWRLNERLIKISRIAITKFKVQAASLIVSWSFNHFLFVVLNQLKLGDRRCMIVALTIVVTQAITLIILDCAIVSCPKLVISLARWLLLNKLWLYSTRLLWFNLRNETSFLIALGIIDAVIILISLLFHLSSFIELFSFSLLSIGEWVTWGN